MPLRAPAKDARVVCTTVGPYAKYGLPVVQACAAAGTHYADLTGEATFARQAIDETDARDGDTRRKSDSSTSRAPAILSTSYVNTCAGGLQKLPQPENFFGAPYFLVDLFLVERH